MSQEWPWGAILLLVLTSCSKNGEATEQAVTTTPAAATTESPITTDMPTTTEASVPDKTSTTSEAAPPPQTFSADTTLEPGTYVTSTFRPQVVFSVDRPIYVDDDSCFFYFESDTGAEHPSWLGFHNSWGDETLDDVVAQVEAHPDIQIEAQRSAEIAGLPAVLLDGVSLRPSDNVYTSDTDCEWYVEQGYVWRFYLLMVADQTLVIAVEVPLDDPLFLSQVEQILGTIQFP